MVVVKLQLFFNLLDFFILKVEIEREVNNVWVVSEDMYVRAQWPNTRSSPDKELGLIYGNENNSTSISLLEKTFGSFLLKAVSGDAGDGFN